ncbi:unnamed protein product [Lactuca saligna]|uniref:Uncharacterized protein n=1 Tax=Lactuca saligna TaxID=75948 RepID=A0AA36EAP8_LACSI|nr:unnamed protein product [Lactuca saligna]
MFDGSEKEDPSANMVSLLLQDSLLGSKNCGLLCKMEMKRDSLKLETRTKNCTIGLESDAGHIVELAIAYMDKLEKNKRGIGKRLNFKRIKGKRLNKQTLLDHKPSSRLSNNTHSHVYMYTENKYGEMEVFWTQSCFFYSIDKRLFIAIHAGNSKTHCPTFPAAIMLLILPDTRSFIDTFNLLTFI